MRLSRKFQKLLSRDAAESFWENACRWTHPVNSRQILADIDRTELENLRERYPYRPNARKINAYEDAAYWIGVNVKRAQDLWLDRCPPLDILDLGCGAGYFLYLCRLFGHDGLGFDTDEEPFFRGTTKFFNVRRVIGRIEPQTPLPDFANQTAVCCWSLIRDRTDRHFLRRSCAFSLSRKAREFSVGKRFWQRIQVNAHGSNRRGRDAAPQCQSGSDRPDSAERCRYPLQLPVRTIPA